MPVTKTKAKPPTPAGRRAPRQLKGQQLALLLRKIDSAKSEAEKKRWRRQFMRGFYGDTRADFYA